MKIWEFFLWDIRDFYTSCGCQECQTRAQNLDKTDPNQLILQVASAIQKAIGVVYFFRLENEEQRRELDGKISHKVAETKGMLFSKFSTPATYLFSDQAKQE